MERKVREYKEFLQAIRNQLEEKKAELFVESRAVNADVPDDFVFIEEDYRKLVLENNNNNLSEKQNEAHEKLILHYVKEQIEESNYKSLVGQLSVLDNELKQRDVNANIKVSHLRP